MPRGRTKRKTTKRSAHGASHRKTSKTYKKVGITDLSKRGHPFPSTLLAKFNYSDAKTYSPTAGLASSNLYRLDDLYDPDSTGVGTKVNYYDDLISGKLYRFNRVYGAKVKVQLVNESTSPTTVQLVLNTNSVITNALATGNGDVDTLISNPRNWIVNLGSADGGRNQYTRSFYVKNHAIVGRTKSQYLSGQQYRYAYNNGIVPAPTDRDWET